MEPVGMADAIDTLAVVLIGMLVLVAAVEMRHRLFQRSSDTRPRSAARISDREMELVGEDYRVHVAAYFNRVERRRQIVQEIANGD